MMQLIKKAWKLGRGYFVDKETRKKAWLFVVGSFAFELLGVAFYVLMNKWTNEFYASLQNLDPLAFIAAMKFFIFALIYGIIVFAVKYVMQSKLALSWRTYMTDEYLQKWLANKAYYGSSIVDETNENPDQRISEDIASFTSNSISLVFGILNSVITLISFLGILWMLSGIFKFSLFNKEITIYGYLVWVALVYAFVITFISFKIGKKLSEFDYLQEKKEANFRFSMMRLRENSESIALYRGENYEQNFFKASFNLIVENTLSLIKISKNLIMWRNFYSNIASFLPIAISVPKLFRKEITLGDVMQIAQAFDKVLDAFLFFASSIKDIASYKAVVQRLSELNNNLENWNYIYSNCKIKFKEEGETLEINNLSVFTPKGKKLFNLSYNMEPGKSYLITGDNGVGKSTLIKILGKLWLFGQGEIIFPKSKKIFFIPQNTYMSAGTLRDMICYPSFKDKDITASLLNKVNLSHLADRIDNNENWSISLSLGEQQKIAILRALIHKPDILIMDKSTSGITHEDQAMLYKFLRKELPNSIIISVGHGDELKKFHDEKIKL